MKGPSEKQVAPLAFNDADQGSTTSDYEHQVIQAPKTSGISLQDFINDLETEAVGVGRAVGSAKRQRDRYERAAAVITRVDAALSGESQTPPTQD